MSDHKWLTEKEVAELEAKIVKYDPEGIIWTKELCLIADCRKMRELLRLFVDESTSQDAAIQALDDTHAMLEATK